MCPLCSLSQKTTKGCASPKLIRKQKGEYIKSRKQELSDRILAEKVQEESSRIHWYLDQCVVGGLKTSEVILER